MTPLISIIIPVYNSEKTLQRAVYSTCKQNVTCEIIIINDCSSDKSLEVANTLSTEFSNLSVINLDTNGGASKARNKGIAQAKGEYIAFLDADDVWLPFKLEKQLDVMLKNPQCTLVSCDSLQISPKGTVLRRAHVYKPPVNGPDAWKTLLSYNFTPTPSILTKTSLVRKLGGFDETLKISEDLDLWISLAKHGDVIVLPDVYVHYFDYSNSLMKRDIYQSFLPTLTMIEKHMKNEPRLSEQERRKIMAQRYFNIASDALGSLQHEEADKYFKLAIESGYSAYDIKKRLFKKKIKSLLKR